MRPCALAALAELTTTGMDVVCSEGEGSGDKTQVSAGCGNSGIGVLFGNGKSAADCDNSGIGVLFGNGESAADCDNSGIGVLFGNGESAADCDNSGIGVLFGNGESVTGGISVGVVWVGTPVVGVTVAVLGVAAIVTLLLLLLTSVKGVVCVWEAKVDVVAGRRATVVVVAATSRAESGREKYYPTVRKLW